MLVSEYVKTTTAGNRITFLHFLEEVWELVQAIIRLDKENVSEEWQDSIHFFQLWAYWRLGLDQHLWQCTSKSTAKFMARVEVWQKIYEYVGLPKNISGYAGNYNRLEKVETQLVSLGISKELAHRAYSEIVRK